MIPTRCKSILTLSCLLTIAVCGQTGECEAEGTIVKSLGNLTEPFETHMLPGANELMTTCFSLIGCIEELPFANNPADPSTYDAAFKIYRRGGYTTKVEYNAVKNCLASSPSTCNTYPYDLNLLLASNFDPTLPTVILIDGYRSEGHLNWMPRVKDLWLKLSDANIILTKWTGANRGVYQQAAANSRVISRQISVLLYYLAKLNNYELSDEGFTNRIYLVGQSLGGHISGFVGKDLAGQVGRITGLDPAGPLFTKVDRKYRLDRGDAALVIALHTNAGQPSLGQLFYGIKDPIGHLDLYANDGEHQPGCTYDVLGHSHMFAIELFISFLQHQEKLRRYLDGKPSQSERVFVFRSETFEQFHTGDSLSKLCTLTTLDDRDLHMEDFEKCAVPVDMTAEPLAYRKELAEKYGVSFEPSIESPRLYFYTYKVPPLVDDHSLMKVRVSKTENIKEEPKMKGLLWGISSGAAYARKCDLQFKLEMQNGLTATYMVKAYELIEGQDHYEVVVPFLSAGSTSSPELARLDTNDFFLTNRSQLLASVSKVFPSRITITGLLLEGEAGRQNLNSSGSFWAKLSDLFTYTSSDYSPGSHRCSLSVETITIQPLRRLHRHFVATYSLKAENKQAPDVVVLKEGEESPKVELRRAEAQETAPDSSASQSATARSSVYLDTLIIGPVDENFNLFVEMSPFDNGSGEGGEHANMPSETSNLSASFWFTMSALAIAVLLTISSVAIYKLSRPGGLLSNDRLDLMNDAAEMEKY